MNAGGTITENYAYDAYGTLVVSNTTPTTVYLFAGEQFDADLGLYYNRARYLKTDTGRFWTMDSYEGRQIDPLSLHKYLYTHGNPVNSVDPSGYTTLNEVQVTTFIQMKLRSMQFPVLRVATVFALNTAVQLRLREMLGSLSSELFELSDSLAGLNSVSSQRTREFAEQLEASVSVPNMLFNILLPSGVAAIPGKGGVIGGGLVSLWRGAKLEFLARKIMTSALRGVNHDDGTRFFDFRGDEPAIRISRIKAFFGAYNMADDVKPLRHFIDAWKNRDVVEMPKQFLSLGRNLAKYGDYSGQYGIRGAVSSASGGVLGWFKTQDSTFSFGVAGAMQF